MNNKTYQPKPKEIKRDWYLVDAKDKILGRMASKIASLLVGKNKPGYAYHLDTGDYVVVVNAKKVRVTGRKAKQKTYRKHSGYPGGFKEVKFEKLIEEQPEKVIQFAVSGMLPDNRLKRGRINRLKIFADAKHPYEDKLGVKKEK
jgi:large subunit ribosomal protein L13